MSDDADATGVNNVSGAELDAKAMEKTGKTMEQLTEEKRKEVRQYEKDWGNEHTKQRTNQILP
jgi:hypothetical protein